MINKPSGTDGLSFFLYRSSAIDGLTRNDLEDILEVARLRNQSLKLTGCLHHEDGLFFQWLEGPAQEIEPAIASIMGDPRHRDLTVLGRGALDARRFQDWRMRFSDRDSASLMDWFARNDKPTVDRHDYAASVASFLSTAIF